MEETKRAPITQNAYDRLKEELDLLEGEARTTIISAIATARAHGDLSENAEYHAAKDQQGLQESRVRQIRDILENSEVVEATDDGVAGPGMIVTIKHQGEEPETFLLGLREEKGGEHEILTPDSPIGKALIGRSAGETVAVTVPAGEMKVELLEVRAP